MRGRRRVLALALVAATVAGCANGRHSPYRAGDQPGWPKIGAALPAGTTAYSNRSLARLFTMLTLDLEWGAHRPHLVRYENPVRVTIEGPGTAQYAAFLSGYLEQLRTEAGVDIARADRGDDGNLHVRFVEGPAFEAALPAVSCLVVPGNTSFEQFAAAPGRYGGARLAALKRIEQTSILIPQTAPPYLVRGCLMEEIAQALGPANDLYGLGPSIFNDDAAHVWPTRLDLLMLRVLYQPELGTGLSRPEAERAAWAVLDRLNPEGRAAADLALPRQREMAEWRDATQRIFARGKHNGERQRLAEKALRIAETRAPGSAYHCQSLVNLAKVLSRTEPSAALRRLDEALPVCTGAHGRDDVRIARIRVDRAMALSAMKQPSRLLAETEGLDLELAAYGLDERLATLYALRSSAYRAIQQGKKSFTARRLARDWGAFALGVDNEALIAWLKR